MSFLKMKPSYFYFLGLILYVILAFSWGTSPRQVSNPPAFYSNASAFECLAHQPLLEFYRCKSFGYPKGAYFVQSMPYYMVGLMVERVFHKASLSASVTSNFFLLLAFIGVFLFLFELGVSKMSALFGSFVFLVQPFMVNQICYGTTTVAFSLLPLLLFFDLKWLSLKVDISRLQFFMIFFGQVLLRCFMLLMDGYGFMMLSLASAALVGATLIKNRKDYLYCFKVLSMFLLSSMAAVLFYKVYVPNFGRFDVESADLFRAQGVDLFSLFRPSTYYGFYRWLGFGYDYDPFTFYGDSSNVRMNFSGYLGLVLSLAYVVWGKSRKALSFVLVFGLIAFFLSLGPSLKINSRRLVPLANQSLSYFTKDVAMMPPGDAVFSFHTEQFYTNTPGIQNMRAVYRWLLLVKLSLLVFSLFALDAVIKKRRFWGYLLLAVFVLEWLPDFPLLFSYYSYQRGEVVRFNQEVIDPLRSGTVPGKKIYYLSSELDYFADYMTAKSQLISYSISGDKSIEIARRFWPETIRNMRNSIQVAENVHRALYDGTVDYVLIPYFDLRWDAYFWPPTPEKTMARRAKQRDLIQSVEGVDVKESAYFSILTRSH